MSLTPFGMISLPLGFNLAVALSPYRGRARVEVSRVSRSSGHRIPRLAKEAR
jgi:hypothetical protein